MADLFQLGGDMTSALQDIADTLATEFRDAVIDAERSDVETIEQIIRDFNEAYQTYTNRDNVLNTQAEQALKTLSEISELRDVNTTTYQRKVSALRDALAEFRAAKLPGKSDPDNVVRLETA
jgi:hypothetical protein